ncbi:MAG TPA: hypothetical protein VJC18_07815, partial [bacterium]|nr:hypothetical protein [bacterium]
MPVFLYSGPASEQKRDRLFSLVNQHLTGQVPGIVVVPDQSYVNSHKTRILLRQKERALIGQTVMTWDDLLLGWIKHNLPRVHLADQTFCHYLLFLLIEKNYPELIRDRHSAHATVLELYRFFQGLKSCGVGPEEVSQSLKNRLEQKELWALFTDYQAQ